MKITTEIKTLIKNAYREDAPKGDITTNYFGNHNNASAKIIAKEACTLCGIEIVKACFKYINPKIQFTPKKKDGAQIKKGAIVAHITGPAADLLLAERTALNFLQMLSGIASQTCHYVNKTKGTSAAILDTRKTIPGLRTLSKYAIRCGGGSNHRMSLSDAVLIKENHLAGLTNETLKKQIQKLKKQNPKMKIEIEAENMAQVKKFLSLPIHVILLDNMPLKTIKKSVKLRNVINPKIKLEVSGNVSLTSVSGIAKTGIDFISVGSLTHTVKAVDFSLLIKEINGAS